MIIRKYLPTDSEVTAELFYNTVHVVNAADYTREQLDAWAPSLPDPRMWNASFQSHFSLVAVHAGILVGFGDIDESGYLDRLFVHADYQHLGIGTALCDQLEQQVQENIITHASVSAKGFFENRGYEVLRKQQVKRHGILLTNYVMQLYKKTETGYIH